jgi:hypothetical protein
MIGKSNDARHDRITDHIYFPGCMYSTPSLLSSLMLQVIRKWNDVPYGTARYRTVLCYELPIKSDSWSRRLPVGCLAEAQKHGREQAKLRLVVVRNDENEG